MSEDSQRVIIHTDSDDNDDVIVLYFQLKAERRWQFERISAKSPPLELASVNSFFVEEYIYVLFKRQIGSTLVFTTVSVKSM